MYYCISESITILLNFLPMIGSSPSSPSPAPSSTGSATASAGSSATYLAIP